MHKAKYFERETNFNRVSFRELDCVLSILHLDLVNDVYFLAIVDWNFEAIIKGILCHLELCTRVLNCELFLKLDVEPVSFSLILL